MFLILASLQLGTFDKKIEAFPLELNCFLLIGSIGSYFPGPG